MKTEQGNKKIEYSELSVRLTKEISKEEKKKQGIYFTPFTTIQTNLELIDPFIKNIKTVLEPSCGTCGFILALSKFKHLNMTGIEYNKTIYDSVKHIANDKISIINEDYLKYTSLKKYDLIIGNPPYFVMKKKDVVESFHKYFDGRPNIFILFIAKSLDLLNDNGLLSFVLPQTFLNCLYYDKVRQHINDNFDIINIIKCYDEYIETKQETIIMIIQKKKKKNSMYTLDINNYVVFGIKEDIKQLKLLYKCATNLSDLGFTVNVGTVVWNQCKSLLTNDETKTRLIYSSDIADKKLTKKKYVNKDKKNFIEKKGETIPILVINRGYGVGGYSFEYCLIEGEFEYLIENHLICIKYTKQVNNNELIELYKKIIKSLGDKRTEKFINLYFGNNAINTTELNYMLPIYDF